MISILDYMRDTMKHFPHVFTLLSARARWMSAIPDVTKSYDYFLRTLTHMVHSVYDGYMGGDFIDIMASLVQGQLTRAYQEGVLETGLSIDEMTEEMQKEIEKFILSEYDFVDQFYRDIVDAKIDGSPVDPLLIRAKMWANRYNDVKNAAIRTVTALKGGKLIWMLGDAEHCTTCLSLSGTIAFAKEWEESGFKPQSPPNPLLECQGWNCKCSLVPTDKRRSPKALAKLLDLAITRYL